MQLSYIQVVSKLYDTPTEAFTEQPGYASIAEEHRALMSFIAAEVPKLEEIQDFRAQFAKVLTLLEPIIAKCPQLEELRQCEKICREFVKADQVVSVAGVQNSGLQQRQRQPTGLAALAWQARQPLGKSAVSPIDVQQLAPASGSVYEGERVAFTNTGQIPPDRAFAEYSDSAAQVQYARPEKAPRYSAYEAKAERTALERDVERAPAFDWHSAEMQLKSLHMRHEIESLEDKLEIYLGKCRLLENQLSQLQRQRADEAATAAKRIADLQQLCDGRTLVLKGGFAYFAVLCLLLCVAGLGVGVLLSRS